jgi:hypothetical protein
MQPLHRPFTAFITALLVLGWGTLIFELWGCNIGLCHPDAPYRRVRRG